MKAKDTAVMGALAVGGLLAAYATWQRPRDTSAIQNGVTVVDASRQTLERVRFEDGTRFVDVVRRVEGEPQLWVTQGYLPGKTPTQADAGVVELDGGVDGGALLVSVKPAAPTPTREMHGNERAEALYARFSPLEATRGLGVQQAEKLKELGLDSPERRLDVTVTGTTRTFTVSRQLSGVFGTYLHEPKTGQVYLLQGSLLSELDPSAQVLVDRRLHVFRIAEVDAFTLSAGGKSAGFLVSNADAPQTMKVARAASPQTAEELVKNWYDKTWNRVVVTEVLGKGESPKVGEPQVVLRMDLASRGKPKGWLELAMDPTAGTWARSENTAGWVAVHQGADELVVEAKKLLAEPK